MKNKRHPTGKMARENRSALCQSSLHGTACVGGRESVGQELSWGWLPGQAGGGDEGEGAAGSSWGKEFSR